MRVITWNCNGALRTKFPLLAKLEADICVVQECEDPASVNHPDYVDWATNHLWVGERKSKGLGVFARQSIKVKRLDWPSKELRYFLPCEINSQFNLVGVWAHKAATPRLSYIGQVWAYSQANSSRLREKECLIAGDFNSNKIWDKHRKTGNHSDVVSALDEIKIRSLYHHAHSSIEGAEKDSTFYLYRKPEHPYHIDYIFGSRGFQQSLLSIDIGDPKPWLKKSDHIPVVADFDMLANR